MASGGGLTFAFQKIFQKGLTNSELCVIIQNISCEEDKQSIANVYREPTVGVSR
ncbi:hypothetical protein SAMN02910353_02579 [Ruminococcus sp. YRD2003]|nr:hypothetical protein SAMN02910353_02579 [Ruminococcus flavefaciens]